MSGSRVKWIFYPIGFALILGIKYFYSQASCDELLWILAPTARWVSILGGIAFEYIPGIGYVSDQFRFIIAPSCSGVQFMIVMIATVVFSFVHRMGTVKAGGVWVLFSLAFSYLSTVLVNGIRILVSIYLPIYLQTHDIVGGWMDFETLHTMIGVMIYFSSLCLLYLAAGYVSNVAVNHHREVFNFESSNISRNTLVGTIMKYSKPVFWYFFIVLGIPLINQVSKDNWKGVMEYAAHIIAPCISILSLFFLISVIQKYISNRKQ